MIVKKITTCFVVQSFDSESKDLIDQEFISSDEVIYEDEQGEEVTEEDVEGLYHSFMMVQSEK